MNKIAIVYHRIDGDGLTSYAVLRRALGIQYPEAKIVPIGFNHGDALPELGGYGKIYIADIALPAEEMRRLYDENRLVWIDHHATSIADAVAGGYSNAPGLRREGVGACELCWEYMYAEEVPMFVQLISAYDVFDKKRFDWESMTLPFQYGVRQNLGLNPDAFLEALRDGKLMEDKLAWLLSDGRTIVRYVRQGGARAAKTYGFTVTLAGSIKALCLLTADFGSIAVEETARESGCSVIICANRLDAESYKISCYSTSGDAPIHLGEYLKETYGGGGHRNAAGAVIGFKEFESLIREEKI